MACEFITSTNPPQVWLPTMNLRVLETRTKHEYGEQKGTSLQQQYMEQRTGETKWENIPKEIIYE